MDRSIHQTVYLLVITLVINFGGWTFNKAAVADVWFDEQHSIAVDDGHASAEFKVHKTASPEIMCNHWCHIVGHFVGLFSQSALVTSEFANEYSTQRSFVIKFHSPDGRFRPPRLLS
ncbi:hypothetical protein [Sulfuriferula thiophila]|uniref:hypothetical protein n=1 Tax=Sulfuriferula thiophila TaxID=1781211 RepID=UPI000F60FF08|nr:hypothetical protein [Sulfuriferula thiophila]